MNKKILQLALPSIVSNITVPLLGLVDVAIVGHLGAASYIGAIAVGGMLFNIIYWLFGFLRMGTSGMTSQALGRRDPDGNEWDDFTGSGETGSPGSNEGFVPVGRCRDSDFSGSASAPVSDTGNSFLTIGYDG